METSTYVATTYWVIGVNIIFLISSLWLLKTGRAAGLTRWVFGVVSLCWIVFIHFALSNKLFIPINISGGAFYILTLSSATLVLAVFYFSPIKTAFENVSQQNIQLVQGLRVFVASGFFTEGVLKIIPDWFSIMDGYMHVTSGYLALVAAISVLKNQRFKNAMLWLANIVGVLDIVIIVTSICFVVWNDLGAFHNMQYVVFYTGVLLLWFHFTSISKLLKNK